MTGHYLHPHLWECVCGDDWPCPRLAHRDRPTQEIPRAELPRRGLDREEIGILIALAGLLIVAVVSFVWGVIVP